ncbi:MAG: histidinol dehydrogenase, partial [Alphaproteobacteria bacterium]
MPVVFLKRAAKTASAEAESVGDTVKKILDEIEAGGEDVARAYAARFDQYQGPLLLSEEEIEAASAQVSQKLKDDIAFAHDNVR